MTNDLIFFKINTPNVVYENYENEVVLINLETGIYYSISNTAAEIFRQIQQVRSKSRILDMVKINYEGNPSMMIPEVEKFLEDLLNEELIIVEEKNIDISLFSEEDKDNIAADPVRHPFESPVLNRYSDMQDLLLLDPVHDVDKIGWPNPKPPDPDEAV